MFIFWIFKVLILIQKKFPHQNIYQSYFRNKKEVYKIDLKIKNRPPDTQKNDNFIKNKFKFQYIPLIFLFNQFIS